MLSRRPLPLFGVKERDRPKDWVAGVLTDCLSDTLDNWGAKKFRTSTRDRRINKDRSLNRGVKTCGGGLS